MGTITGHTGSFGKGRLGPFPASNGDLFVVDLDNNVGVADEIAVYRSTDGGDTWTGPVLSNREGNGPPVHDDIVQLSAAIEKDATNGRSTDDELWVIWQTTSTKIGMVFLRELETQVFNMATNTWVGTYTQLAQHTSSSAECDIVRPKGGNDAFIVYEGAAEVVMSTNRRRLYGRRHDGTSWQTAFTFAPNVGAADDARIPALIESSQAGQAHCIWERPAGSFPLENLARTWQGGTSISTIIEANIPATGDLIDGPSHIVSFDNGTNFVIGYLGVDGTNGDALWLRYIEDGGNDISGGAEIDIDNTNDYGAGTAESAGAYCISSDVLWWFGTGNVDEDLYSNTISLGGSGSWDGRVLRITGTVTQVYAQWFTHSVSNGGASVVGVVYRDGASTIYVEYECDAGGATVNAPQSTGRIGFKTDGTAKTSVQAPQSTAKMAIVTDGDASLIVAAPQSTARVSFVTDGDASLAVFAPQSTARVSWRTEADARAVVTAPSSTAQVSWLTNGTGTRVIPAPASTARISWTTDGDAIVVVNAPESEARQSWRTNGDATTIINSPASTTRFSVKTDGDATVEVHAPASEAKVGWKTSADARVDVQAPTSTGRAVWLTSADGTRTLVAGVAVARIGWITSADAIIEIQAAGIARVGFITDGAATINVSSGIGQARVAFRTSGDRAAGTITAPASLAIVSFKTRGDGAVPPPIGPDEPWRDLDANGRTLVASASRNLQDGEGWRELGNSDIWRDLDANGRDL